MKKAVVFLQNAWSPLYAGDYWPRPSWLKALHRSRSGQRLSLIQRECQGAVELYYENTTPICGENPSSVVPADSEHIRAVLDAQQPCAVVASGKQAASVLPALWDGPLLLIPHPAWRLLTNELYVQAGELLRAEFKGVIELRQTRKGVVKVHHNTAVADKE